LRPLLPTNSNHVPNRTNGNSNPGNDAELRAWHSVRR